MSRRLFHLALPMPFELARQGQTAGYTPPGFDREGFVHLSFAEQLRGTLNAHFAAADAVFLLELDPSDLASGLRLEASRGGALFPHHYGPLPWAAFERQWLLRRRPSGFEIPYLDPDPTLDIPTGERFPS